MGLRPLGVLYHVAIVWHVEAVRNQRRSVVVGKFPAGPAPGIASHGAPRLLGIQEAGAGASRADPPAYEV